MNLLAKLGKKVATYFFVYFQPCPSGQSGNATWQCGPNGDWIDFPDLSNCSKIDTDQIKKDLAQNDSVPSLVINNLYNNVTNEAELVRNGLNAIKRNFQN